MGLAARKEAGSLPFFLPDFQAVSLNEMPGRRLRHRRKLRPAGPGVMEPRGMMECGTELAPHAVVDGPSGVGSERDTVHHSDDRVVVWLERDRPIIWPHRPA